MANEIILAISALAAGAAIAKRADNKKKLLEAPTKELPSLPTDKKVIPDIPEILKAVEDSPEESVSLVESDGPTEINVESLEEMVKPLEEKVSNITVQAKETLKTPVLPTLTVNVFTDEERNLFPQFDKLRNGDFTCTTKEKDAKGYPVLVNHGISLYSIEALLKGRTNSYDSYMEQIKKIQSEGLKQILTPLMMKLANRVFEIIESAPSASTIRSDLFSQTMMPPNNTPQAGRKGEWGEIFNTLTSEKARMKTLSSGVYENWLAGREPLQKAMNDKYADLRKVSRATQPELYNSMTAEYEKLKDKYNQYSIDNPRPDPTTYQIPEYLVWVEAKIKAYKELITDNTQGSYQERRALYLEWEKKNPMPYKYSSDYTDEGYDFMSKTMTLMGNFEMANFTPWSDMYDGTTSQSEWQISDAKKGLPNLIDGLKALLKKFGGGISPAVLIDELTEKARNVKIELEEFQRISNYGKTLIKEFFPDPQFYIDIIKSDYQPEFIRELDKRKEEAENEYFKNEVRPKNEKANAFSYELSSEQISYLINKSFFNIKVDFINAIKAHFEKYKYTETGDYKRSELIKEGFSEWKEIPTKFLQWANLPFHPDAQGMAEESIIEMMKMLIFWNDARSQFDFYQAVKPMISEFDLLYEQVVLKNPGKEIKSTERYAVGIDQLKEIMQKISREGTKFNSTIWALGPDVVPSSMYSFSNKKAVELSYGTGEPTPETKAKMREILGERQEEYIKVFPDEPLDFESLSHRAYYLFRIDPVKLKLAGYFKERKLQLKKQITDFKISKIENGDVVPEVIEQEVSLEAVNEIRSKINVFGYIDQVEKFFYTKEEILADKEDHSKFIEHVKKIRFNEASKNTTVSNEQVLFLDNALIPYLEKSLAEKSKVYAFIMSAGVEFQKKKELTSALETLNNALATKTYLGVSKETYRGTDYSSVYVPEGHFVFPRNDWQMSNPSLNYHIVLKNTDLEKYIMATDNPIGEKMTRLLMAPIGDYPMGVKAYMSTYIALAGKGSKIADEYSRRKEDFTQAPEFAFYNLLFHFLLKKIRCRYDIRSMLEVTPYGTSWKVGDWGQGGAFLETKMVDIERSLQRMESYLSNQNYNPDWLWDKLLTVKSASNVTSLDFMDTGIFTAVEIELLKYSYSELPSPAFILNYSHKYDILPKQALAEIDKMTISYIKFVQARIPKNSKLDHDNWTSINPTFNKFMSEYNRTKYLMLKGETEVTEAIFKDLVSYLEYWEKHDDDKGWTGTYDYLFKQDAPKHTGIESGIIAGLGSLPPMENFKYHSRNLPPMEDLKYYSNGEMSGMFDFVGKAFEAVKSPFEKAFDAAKGVASDAAKIASPITGAVKEVFDDVQKSAIMDAIKNAYDDTIKKHLMDRLANAMSDLEKAALRPAAKAIKSGVYEIIPRSAFQAFNRLVKVPFHLVANKGKLSKADIRGALTDFLRVAMGAAVIQRLTFKQTGKSINHLTKHTEFFEKLDLYSGGLLSSTANLSVMPEEIAEGREIDRQYVLYRTVDAVKVGAVAFSFGSAGPLVAGVGLATQVGTNAILGETNWVKDSGMRSAISVVAAAGAAYATAGASTTASATTVAATEGGKAAGGAAVSTAAGSAAGSVASQQATNQVVKLTFQEALTQAAVREAKAQVTRVATREILSEAGLSNSEIAILAVGIGVAATVAVIGTQTKWNDEVIQRAKAVAIEQAEKRADVELKKIDPNLSVANIKAAYKLGNMELKEIVEEKARRFEQYVKSGEILEDAQKEAERWAKREAKEQLSDLYEKYEAKFLDWLMDKFGIHADYDQFIKPETYIEYVDITLQLEKRGRVVLIETVKKKKKMTKALVIGGVAAAMALFGIASMEE